MVKLGRSSSAGLSSASRASRRASEAVRSLDIGWLTGTPWAKRIEKPPSSMRSPSRSGLARPGTTRAPCTRVPLVVS